MELPGISFFNFKWEYVSAILTLPRCPEDQLTSKSSMNPGKCATVVQGCGQETQHKILFHRCVGLL